MFKANTRGASQSKVKRLERCLHHNLKVSAVIAVLISISWQLVNIQLGSKSGSGTESLPFQVYSQEKMAS